MVTSPNLDRIAELGWRFISRLPSVYKRTDEVKARAFAEGGRTEVGQISPGKRAASYRVQERSGVIDGRGYRLIVVVVNSSLEKRREQVLSHAIDQESQAIAARAARWATAPYSCREDATGFARSLRPQGAEVLGL